MTNPLFIASVIGVPIALVIVLLLWRRSRSMSADPWYEAPYVGNTGDNLVQRGNQVHVESDAGGSTTPTCDLLDLCEKMLFCWDYWSSGKSGLNLQDVFEARDLPTQLRTTIAKVRDQG